MRGSRLESDYKILVTKVCEHLDEWHTTDDDGSRSCDYTSDCILNDFQG